MKQTLQILKTKMQKQKWITYSLVFIATTSYFMLWAVIRPPFQSPDEFTHTLKTYSVVCHPWIAHNDKMDIPVKYINPLLAYHRLYSIRFDRTEKLNHNDIVQMKAKTWTRENGTLIPGKKRATAAEYPTPYYWIVFLGGELSTSLLKLTPYETIYAYRMASLLLSASLWTWLFVAFCGLEKLKRYKNILFWGCVLIPMNGFICSAVSPDAAYIPLANLSLVYMFRAIYSEKIRYRIIAFALLMLTALCKPAGTLLLASILFAGFIYALRKDKWKTILTRSTIISGGAIALSIVIYYMHITPQLHGAGVNHSLFSYLQNTLWICPDLLITYWGRLGWLDYDAPIWIYSLLFWVLFMNIIFAVLQKDEAKDTGWVPYALLVGLIYVIGSFIGEYHWLSRSGYILQGRYFLPVGCALSAVFIHRIKALHILYAILLFLLNITLIAATFERYYNNDITIIRAALPF